MVRDDFNALIVAFLERPGDESTIDRIVDRGAEVFELVDTYAGPLPDGMDFRDAGGTLALLLGRIGDRYPAKLIHHLQLRVPWPRKWRYLYAAALSQNPRFGPLIVSHLGDRSVNVKEAVVDILMKHERLWSDDAAKRLRKLLSGKAVDGMTMSRHRIEALLQAIEQRAP
jgi:hypothetical protein